MTRKKKCGHARVNHDVINLVTRQLYNDTQGFLINLRLQDAFIRRNAGSVSLFAP